MPVVAVLGNHDYHSDQVPQVVRGAQRRGITVLEGDGDGARAATARRLGVAGVKGFGGGFAGALRQRLRRAGDEGVRAHHRARPRTGSAAALRGLDCDVRVALTHYAPVPDTLVGEPLEIYPFLGSYLLGQAIDSAPTALAVHGHAHAGTERGTHPGRGAGPQRRPPGDQAGVQRLPPGRQPWPHSTPTRRRGGSRFSIRRSSGTRSAMD